MTESSKLGELILIVDAVDEDFGRNGKITYFIVEGNNAGVWRIDETTGGLSAVKWPTFQKEDSDTVRTEVLTVEARDGGQISRASRVNVSIEIRNFRDNFPQFNNDVIHVSIAENTTVGSLVAKVTASGPAGMFYDVTSDCRWFRWIPLR